MEFLQLFVSGHDALDQTDIQLIFSSCAITPRSIYRDLDGGLQLLFIKREITPGQREAGQSHTEPIRKRGVWRFKSRTGFKIVIKSRASYHFREIEFAVLIDDDFPGSRAVEEAPRIPSSSLIALNMWLRHGQRFRRSGICPLRRF